MDTKQKKIKVNRQWEVLLKKYLKRDVVWLILGTAVSVFGFILLKDMLGYRYFETKSVLCMAGIMNLCFTVGIIGILRFILQYINQSWNIQSQDFFQEWEQKQRKIQVILGIITGIMLLLAISRYNYMLNHSWKYGNLSTGYVPIGTVVIQWIICRLVINSYMRKPLQLFMENMEQINQKNIEAALRSEQMKVDLISNVSHDLKTPLTSMVGYIELMKKEELSDVLLDYVEVLSRKAQKLKEMIDSLFDLAKTSSGNVELKLEVLEMNRLIEQVQADMEDRIIKSGREIVVILTEEPTDFTADSSYMYRIIQNLVENALKYSQENTRIFLKSSIIHVENTGKENQKKVRFEITNTAGYRMNFTKEQIVERFARGDESRTTEGNGLGLAIVNTYTVALGGSFEVAIDCDQFKASVMF